MLAFCRLTPSTSILNGFSPGAAGLSRTLLSPPVRSSKLLCPSLNRSRSTLSPDRCTRSTSSSRDSSGIRLSDTFASSTCANTLTPPGSDKLSLPTATPIRGKKVRLMSPSRASVRPVFSFTSLMISGLCLFGSKLAATNAASAPASTARPARTKSTYFTNFIPPPYSLATPKGTCPAATCWRADSTWPR